MTEERDKLWVACCVAVVAAGARVAELAGNWARDREAWAAFAVEAVLAGGLGNHSSREVGGRGDADVEEVLEVVVDGRWAR